jgi:hypothetical protein
MSETGVYNATPWQEMKCNKLVVSMYGRSLHHPPSSLHCFTLPMNNKQADAVRWCWLCHPVHTKGCLFIAQSCSMPEAVKSVQIGTHPRSWGVEPIHSFVIFVLHSFIHWFHWYVQNAAIPCCSQELERPVLKCISVLTAFQFSM